MLFWGAGATASLGFRTTGQQAKFLRALVPDVMESAVSPLCDRVRLALGDHVGERWVEALSDLLEILDDRAAGDSGEVRAADIDGDQLAAMRRNWRCMDENSLRSRIVELRGLYDWPALVAAVNACPPGDHQNRSGGAAGSADAGFKLADIFNLLDMHRQSGHGFPDKDGAFLSPQRVIGARNLLALLVQTLFYIEWHASGRTHDHLLHHYDFAIELARRMQSQGLRLAAENGPDYLEKREFILGDVSVVSLNWDPVGLWVQFVANRNLNRAANVPHVGSPAYRIGIYHDLGHFVAGPRVEKDHSRSLLWQPMNVSSARQLNDRDHGADVRARVSRYLFPHGCLWWRECPNCGKLSSHIGDEWAIGSVSLLPPPPLMAFVDSVGFESWKDDEQETNRWDRGEVDARACIHCATLTYAHHTPLAMQSNFKSPPPPFLEEIRREMRIAVQNANHIIFMGYSLPPDDVDYRAFLVARIRKNPTEDPVRCSIVDKADGYGNRWLHGGELERHDLPEAVSTARELFGQDNVRFFGGGIPDVFLDGGARVTAQAVDRLLTWDRS